MNLEKILTDILNQSDKVTQWDLKASYHLENKHLHLGLKAGFPTKSLENTLVPTLEKALSHNLPDFQISITMEQSIKAHRTQLAGKSLRGVKNTIAIASGKGGVGKSTVAVNLAIALAKAGARVGLLDADIYGPSIPLMLGKVEPVEVKDDHYLPIMAHGIQAMSIGYLTDVNQALIWRGPMLAKSLLQMLDLTLWDELDYLFIDLPPGTGDIQLSLVQKIPLAGAIVVTTPQNVATLDAQKALTMFAKTNIDVLGVVENMSLHVCSQCGHQETIFGQGGGEQLASSFHVNLLGQLPLDRHILKHCEEGKPTTARSDDNLAMAFNQTALQAAIALAKKPLNYADKFPPIVVV